MDRDQDRRGHTATHMRSWNLGRFRRLNSMTGIRTRGSNQFPRRIAASRGLPAAILQSVLIYPGIPSAVAALA